MQRTLIRSATIISMDDRIGNLRAGDALVENGRIADIRPYGGRADSEAARRKKPQCLKALGRFNKNKLVRQ